MRIENLKLQYSVASVLGGSFRAGLRNRCDKDVEGHPYFLPESRHTDSAGEPSRRNFRVKRTNDTKSSLQDVGIERARHGGIFPAIGRRDVPAEQESVRPNNVVRERRGLRRGDRPFRTRSFGKRTVRLFCPDRRMSILRGGKAQGVSYLEISSYFCAPLRVSLRAGLRRFLRER